MEVVQKSQRVSLYLHMKEEVQTSAILKRLLLANKECFIPYYKGKESCISLVTFVLGKFYTPLKCLAKFLEKIRKIFEIFFLFFPETLHEMSKLIFCEKYEKQY